MVHWLSYPYVDNCSLSRLQIEFYITSIKDKLTFKIINDLLNNSYYISKVKKISIKNDLPGVFLAQISQCTQCSLGFGETFSFGNMSSMLLY